MKILTAALVILAVVPAPAADLPDAASVLDRFVDAVGGRAACESVSVRHYRGTIVQDLSWTDPQHQETPFLAEADIGGLVRYAEVASWSDLPVGDAADLRSKLRWILHPRFALVVEEFFPGLEVTGRETRDGHPVLVLTPAELKFEHYALSFDEETGLLSHIGYHNDLGDWREVDGVLTPHRLVFGRKGGHTDYVFEEVASGRAPGD